MARLAIVSTVSPGAPTRYQKPSKLPIIATLGQAGLDWLQKREELKQYTDYTERTNRAENQINDIVNMESQSPDYATLESRVSNLSNMVVADAVDGIGDGKTREEIRRRVMAKALEATAAARDQPRGMEIAAGRRAFEGRMVTLQDQAAGATGEDLARLTAEAKVQSDAAIHVGLFNDESQMGEFGYRAWIGNLEEARLLAMIRPDPLDPSGADKRLVAAYEGLKNGTIGAGMTPLARERGLTAVESEFERRVRDSQKPWPSDPATLIQARAMVMTGGAPAISRSDLASLYWPQKRLSEEDWKPLDAAYDSFGNRGRDETTARLHFEHSNAVDLIKEQLGASGLLAQLGKMDNSLQAAIGGAFDDYLKTSAAFPEGKPSDALRLAPLEAARKAVRDYRPQIRGNTEAFIKSEAALLPQDVYSALVRDGIDGARRALGPFSHNLGVSQEDYYGILERLDGIEKAQRALNAFREQDASDHSGVTP